MEVISVMIFETHAHYDDEAFDEDREVLLSSLPGNGIEYVVNVSASIQGCHDTIKLVQQYDFMYGALGIHPDEVGGLCAQDIDMIKDLAGSNSKIVAIGETGLDYYEVSGSTRPKTTRKEQQKWFECQLELARELSLPVMIHSREAAKDTEDILRAAHAEEIGGIIHCYSYSKESAKFYLNNGFYLGIGGVVTFKNGRVLKEVVEYAPLTQLVLETDSPYLAPVPNRGKRNSSLNIPYIAREIAAIKGVSYDEVVNVTCSNARKLLGI